MDKIINNKHADTKSRIMDVAIELFGKYGFDGTSTRNICKMANVNISMISYYFGGKEGLYKFILNDLLNKQLEYINKFYNPDMLSNLSRVQKAKMFLSILDKMVDFLYGQMSDKLMLFLIKEQRNIAKDFVPPIVPLLRGILGSILDKDVNSKEIAFQGLFIASQISSPRFMSVFLKPYWQNGTEIQDIDLIKDNVKQYMTMIFKNAGIDL